ncbi:rhomboid family intramembrane serine protease [Sphingosinicella sp.]|uniref:rhomboid family intramembrane serine protease n=1 Tax=Sphingosinicella sp. TaxID=1917971 RepID=UPI004037ACE3
MRVPQGWAQARFTLFITLATAAIYVVLAAIGWDEQAVIWGGFIPARLAFGGDEMLAPFWITPLTAAFLHANLLHLFFNLLILVFCGRPTEAVVGAPGMAILYLLGAFAAAAAQYAAGPLSPVPMIGASGAISAVLGAYAILFGRNKVKVASPRLAMLLNALWLMAAWVVLQLIVGITFAGAGIGVAVAAHIGGFAVGLALANPLLLFRYRKA